MKVGKPKAIKDQTGRCHAALTSKSCVNVPSAAPLLLCIWPLCISTKVNVLCSSAHVTAQINVLTLLQAVRACALSWQVELQCNANKKLCVFLQQNLNGKKKKHLRSRHQ